MPSKKKPATVDSIVQNVQAAITDMKKGDDRAAIMAMAAGCFIVISDLTFRVCKAKIEVKLPTLSSLYEDQKEFWRADASNNLTRLLKETTDVFMGLLPKIKIELPEDGLWDFKITCAGMGLFSAGVTMYLAAHPEYYLKTLEVGQSLAREYMDNMTELIKKATPSMEDVAKIIPLLV